MLEWLQNNETVLWWLASTSVVTFIATLIAVPLLVSRIPADYFSHGRRHKVPWSDRHPLVRVCLLLMKNTFGYIFILVGIVMLVLPGQGILTILIGIMLLDFPGKFRLERWLVSRRPVLRAINWLRRRSNRKPIIVERFDSGSRLGG